MRRRTWLILACIVLAATAAIGGTLAFLTDNDSAVNTMVMGKVDIEMMEYNADGSKFTDGQTLLPGDTLGKQIEVENVGSTDAFVRTWVAVQQGADGASVVTPIWKDGITATKYSETATIEGQKYDLYYVDYALKSGEKMMTLDSIKMSLEADNDDIDAIGSEMKIPVFTQAVQQANMGEMTPALNEAFPKQPWENGKIPEDDSADLYITSVTDLFGFAKSVNEGENWSGKTVELMADIDLAGKTWTPIGNVDGYPGKTFSGTFKGNGHTISNMKAVPANPNSGEATAGLFGSACSAKIQDLTLTNVDVQSTHYAGALLGYVSDNANTIIENCKVIGGKVSSTPVKINNNWDNGDKVGGLIGAITEGSPTKVKNCSVQGVNIKAYRDVGELIGCYLDNTDNVTGCATQGVTLEWDNSHDYKEFGSKDVKGAYFGGMIGRRNDGQDQPEPVKPEVPYVTSREELEKAISDNEGKVIVGGTINARQLSFGSGGKNVTFVGTGENSVFDLSGQGEREYLSTGGSTLAFENITVKFNTEYMNGIAHSNTISFKNCKIEGTLYGYADDYVFENCVFEVSGDKYDMWTWGANDVVMKNCTFNTSGKALLVYNENHHTNVTVENCKFIDRNDYENVNNKAAIETGQDWTWQTQSYTIVVNNTKVSGFDETSKGIPTGTNLWGNKNSMAPEILSVTIDGVKVYGN